MFLVSNFIIRIQNILNVCNNTILNKSPRHHNCFVVLIAIFSVWIERNSLWESASVSTLEDVSVSDGMLESGVGRRGGNTLFTKIKFYSDEKQIRFSFSKLFS